MENVWDTCWFYTLCVWFKGVKPQIDFTRYACKETMLLQITGNLFSLALKEIFGAWILSLLN